MCNWLRRLCTRISIRALAIPAVLNIIGSSIAVVVVDILYQPADVRYYARRADLYIYVVSAILISIWSLYGLLATAKASRKGMKIYFHVLVFLMIISMLIGAIHLILLFTIYRIKLVRSCVDDHMPGQFWWSFGFDRDDEVGRTIGQCSKAWSKLSIQRAIVWGIYSLTLMLMAIVVYQYHRYLESQWRLRIGDGGDDDSFDQETLHDHRDVADEKQVVVHHEDTEKPKKDEIDSVYHQRRQRLYDEIHHKRTRKGSRQTNQQNNNIHPLDPPPLGSAAQRAAEKMDYDFYREHMKHQNHTVRQPIEIDQDQPTEGIMSRRRPTSWHAHNEDSQPHPETQSPTQEEDEESRSCSPSAPLYDQEQENRDQDEDGDGDGAGEEDKLNKD